MIRQLDADELLFEMIKDVCDQIKTYKGVLNMIRSLEKKQAVPTIPEMVPKQFHAYLDVFEKEPSECMLLKKPWDHAINLMPDYVPQKSKLFPCSPMERDEINTFIDDQLQKGYIQPSKSPQTSLVFFIPKKDGKKQMVQDYHYINSKTIKNNFLLPLIPELIDQLAMPKYS